MLNRCRESSLARLHATGSIQSSCFSVLRVLIRSTWCPDGRIFRHGGVSFPVFQTVPWWSVQHVRIKAAVVCCFYVLYVFWTVALNVTLVDCLFGLDFCHEYGRVSIEIETRKGTGREDSLSRIASEPFRRRSLFFFNWALEGGRGTTLHRCSSAIDSLNKYDKNISQ